MSYASWQASLRHASLRAQLGQPGMLKVIYLAGVLFCSGVAAISDPVLEIGLWVVLGGVFLAQWVGLVLRGRRAASG